MTLVSTTGLLAAAIDSNDLRFLLQNAINALSFGSLYALFALGIALIFGIMQLINFAYGELIMVGGSPSRRSSCSRSRWSGSPSGPFAAPSRGRS
jgi:Branched-chain amino acid transport system / permease component